MKKYEATMEKTQTFLPAVNGYEETDIDRRKREVDFRLVATDYIIWKDGRGQAVTKRELKKLEANHTWATDF